MAAFVAQMVERRTFNPVVAGSSPAEGAFYCEFAPLAQWLAHRTSNPGVAGSNPAEDRRSHTHSPDMDWKSSEGRGFDSRIGLTAVPGLCKIVWPSG